MARWPKYIPQETAATAAVSTPLHTKGGRNPGNLKPIKGTKHSKFGGFVNTQNFGGVKGELAAILTKVPNFSLATNTWRTIHENHPKDGTGAGSASESSNVRIGHPHNTGTPD